MRGGEIGKKITSKLITEDVYTKYYSDESGLIETININGNEFTNNIVYGEHSKAELIKYFDGTIIEYTYDNNANITSVIENGKLTSEYKYDQLNRLVSEIDYVNSTISVMTYDMYGNIKILEKYEYKNNAKGKLLSSNDYVYSSNYGDQLVEYNNQSITYDESGKPLTYYNGAVFEWDGDRLIAAKVGEKSIKFKLDSNGTVVGKTVNGVNTIYGVEGTDYIAEITGDDTLIYMYDVEANVIGFTYNGKEYYYVKNALNDIIRIVDGNGDIVCGYAYDAWGNILRIDGNKDIAELNKFRYRSYYYDVDMEMYYLHSRYYDTNLARFISTDQVDMMIYNQENLNMYAYCKNNPILYVDPEGTAVKLVIFTLSEWKTESDNMLDDFEDYYEKRGETVSCLWTVSNNMNSLETMWNNMGTTSFVVINTHASPKNLGNGTGNSNDTDKLTIAEINNLNYKKVDTLVLLGCNAGHYEYVTTNVAYAFCKRISGCVIASDGTVYSDSQYAVWNPIEEVDFKSKNDITFRKHRNEGSNNKSSRDNYGWIVFKYGRTSGYGHIFLDELGKTLTVYNLIECVRINNNFKSYK
ncbi:MAG: RHS repeat-associated core domain-containing protein [Lachnospiraceae bacterium]|nr:RHS repeat-associated core domain-containing protein [Lachnospiraceae bacterium]